MDKKSKLFLAFGAGALVGAGLLALFTTDEGKALVEKAKGKAGDMAGDLKKKFNDLENDLTDFLRDNDPKKSANT